DHPVPATEPIPTGLMRIQDDRGQHGCDGCGDGQARVHRLAPASAGGVAVLAAGAPFPPWAPPSGSGPVAGPARPAGPVALGPPRALWERLSMSQATLTGVAA